MNLKELANTLDVDCKLDPDRPVLAGVSGGPDSLALLHALNTLGYEVIAAHFNHQLRKEASADAAFVQAAAKTLGVPYYSEGADVAAFADENQMSIEEAARDLRYRFLFSQAAQLGAQAVAVAHTADDQVETVLMHFLRGAGLSGLKGMQPYSLNKDWSETIPLVRPLLSVWRREIQAYCNNQDLQPLHDESNDDLTFFRNRLRHELLPYLEEYNPRVREVLWRTAQVLAGDQEIVTDRVDQIWDACVHKEDISYCGFYTKEFQKCNTGEQRGLIRRAIEKLRPNLRDIDFAHVEEALAFVERPPQSGRQDLAAGLRMLSEGEVFWVAAWEAELPTLDWPQVREDSATFALPGILELGASWRMRGSVIEDTDTGYAEALSNENPYAAWLNGENIGAALTVRKRKAGDRFQPLGMGGQTVKLADYFINKKLSRRARERWPLVCVGKQVAWIPGFHLSHYFRLTKNTKTIIKLKLEVAQTG